MEILNINDFDTLLKVSHRLHDSGFRKDNVAYDGTEKIFIITTKEYEYKGRFIKKQTGAIIGECKLILHNAQKCEIIEKDRLGYQTIGEDYFNSLKIRNNRVVIIKSAFHKIKIEIEKIEGVFEYCALNTPVL